MRKALLWCIKAIIALIASLILLSLFTLLYSYSGVHISNETGATDYKWESSQLKSNMSEGFSWMKLNKDGFNNSFGIDDVNHVDTLLMGSSHMEAINVPSDSNVGFLLNNQFDSEHITYNIGISGHTIYQCVRNLGRAVDYYNPSKYIIIETDSVNLEENKMKQVLDGSLPIIPSHDTGAIYYLQKLIPYFAPAYRELGNWYKADISNKDNDNNKPDLAKMGGCSEEYINILENFFNKISTDSKGRNVIIAYQPRLKIGDDGSLVQEDSYSVDRFKNLCDARGIIFVNMYDDFSREYESSHELPHGFINTGIETGHLNETGHRLMAQRLGEIIKELDNGTK